MRANSVVVETLKLHGAPEPVLAVSAANAAVTFALGPAI